MPCRDVESDDAEGHQEPSAEIRERHAEVPAGTHVVVDLSQKPLLAHRRHRIHHHIQHHREKCAEQYERDSHLPLVLIDKAVGRDQEAPRRERGEREEGIRQRIEERYARDHQFAGHAFIDVFIMAVGKAVVNRAVVRQPRDEVAADEPEYSVRQPHRRSARNRNAARNANT